MQGLSEKIRKNFGVSALDQLPGNCGDGFAYAQGEGTAADDVAVARLGRMVAQEGFQVARVLRRGVLGPFDLDRREFASPLHDIVDTTLQNAFPALWLKVR